jgi:hypothetical protein
MAAPVREVPLLPSIVAVARGPAGGLAAVDEVFEEAQPRNNARGAMASTERMIRMFTSGRILALLDQAFRFFDFEVFAELFFGAFEPPVRDRPDPLRDELFAAAGSMVNSRKTPLKPIRLSTVSPGPIRPPNRPCSVMTATPFSQACASKAIVRPSMACPALFLAVTRQSVTWSEEKPVSGAIVRTTSSARIDAAASDEPRTRSVSLFISSILSRRDEGAEDRREDDEKIPRPHPPTTPSPVGEGAKDVDVGCKVRAAS